MGWATHLIDELKRGNTVTFRPHGNSMTPIINSGDLVKVKPISRAIETGDVVLCKVRGAQYLHLVTAVRGEQLQISNNHGHVNGWTSQVYGILVR